MLKKRGRGLGRGEGRGEQRSRGAGERERGRGGEGERGKGKGGKGERGRGEDKDLLRSDGRSFQGVPRGRKERVQVHAASHVIKELLPRF